MAMRGQASPQYGVVTGYLLKLIRESIPLTQEQVAAELGVDRTTIQGWESGRRSFAAVPFGQAITTRQKLGRLGADARLLAAVEDAAEADFILAQILDQQAERVDLLEQPLGWSVLTHRLSEMILWPILDRAPNFVRDLQISHSRRGPVASGPVLPAGQRRAFFTQLHVLAERAATGRHPNFLLHRQACFLAGADPTKESAAWLANGNAWTACRTNLHTWSPLWPSARSVVTSLANQGDPEPLRHFIAHAHPDDACQRAALNYSAYWVGEIPHRQRDDSFMPAARTDWRGTLLLRHLVARLDPGHPFVDLNVHNAWALLAARRGLPNDDPDIGQALATRAALLLESDSISAQSRQELTSIVYSLKADGITGTGTGR